MCGIFGYIGNKSNAANIIHEGLKTLEYRGYDSWGIAIKNADTINIEKDTGKISDRIPTLSQSSIGIGHTRWATHGGVTIENAHPHQDCTKHIAVLHNGIIENYQTLKDELIEKNHAFLSETDTEILPHLLEDEVKEKSFTDAMRNVFNKLQGLNAIVAVNTTSNEIIAAKNGSPLIVGIGDKEYFLASDVAGILPHTKKVIFLKDHELVRLTNDGVELYSLPEGDKIEPEIETVEWNIEQAVKGEFEHFMLKEIFEQPLIIETIAQSYTDQITTLAQVIRKARGTYFIGSGTAFHACLAGTYLFSHIAHRHVNTAPASEFNYLEDFLTPDSLIIPLSQSGETIDVIEPLIRAKQKGSKIIALVNVLGSTIYRMGDYKLLLGAGPEKAVASTKAYVAKISILTLLAHTLGDTFGTAREILLQTAKIVEQILEKESLENIKAIAKLFSTKEHIYIIGRGVSYATALEGALKIKEVSYIHTEGLAGGELKHGTIALIEKGTPCIVLAPQDETYDAIISNATEIKSRGAVIIGISPKKSPVFDHWIEVKDGGSPLITQIIPMQLLAYYLATLKNLDPDKPRNLAKSVTVK